MERDKFKLNNEEWFNLAIEDYLSLNGEEIEIEVCKNEHIGGSRHTESYNKIFCRLDNGKYYQVQYDTSVKDEMGWKECNYDSTEAVEVFPKTVETVIYI